VNGEHDNVLGGLRGDEIAEYETEYCSVECHEPVFPAEAFAGLFNLIEPGLNM
jgi:hypothetical protein